MSAYMKDKEEIDAIVDVLLHGPTDCAEDWRTVNIDPNEIGDMLVRENLSSIHYRYPDCETNPSATPGPCDLYWLKPYKFVAPASRLTRDEAIREIGSYQYQACEHPEWETSKVRNLTDAIRGILEQTKVVPPLPPPPSPPVRHVSITDVAKLIRAELKAAFQGHKFSVRSESYSMGCHIIVRYDDGPPLDAVEAITNKFYGTGFDGMTDSTTYHDADYKGERVHFAGSRPHVSRSFTSGDYGQKAESDCIEILKKYRTYSDWEAHHAPQREAWGVLRGWDAREESLERAVVRYLYEQSHSLAKR